MHALTFVAKPYAGKIFTAVVDVRDDQAVNEWVSTSIKEAGRLDVAANVAGVTGSDKKVNVKGIVAAHYDFQLTVYSCKKIGTLW